ncbi:MAG: PIN domain-containing protein [Verrucomicrobia bacterium]|nr:PIN domain-containing protein [Verrucomicrobiota bacterium]
MIALDTNILIYAHRGGAARHRAAQAYIQRAADAGAWGLASPVVAEFWSQVTHPRFPGGASTSQQAAAFLDSIVAAGARVLLPRPAFAASLIRDAADLGVSGVRIFDLQIALIAVGGGATELWTYDARFTDVPGLSIVRLQEDEA